MSSSGAAIGLLSAPLGRLDLVAAACRLPPAVPRNGKCYAVKSGLLQAVFLGCLWTDVSPFVIGVPGSQYKGFRSVGEAEAWLGPGSDAVFVSPSFLPAARRLAGLTAEPSAGASEGSGAAAAPDVALLDDEEEEEDDDVILIAEEDGPAAGGVTSAVGTGGGSQGGGVAVEDGMLPPGHYDGWFDGASKSNPGPAGWGAFARRSGGGDAVVLSASGQLGRASNNVAEYRALYNLLRLLLPRLAGGSTLRVRGDSMLVLKQVEGQWRASNPDMQRCCAQVRELLRGAKDAGVTVVLQHVKRHLNTDADALASAAATECAAAMGRPVRGGAGRRARGGGSRGGGGGKH